MGRISHESKIIETDVFLSDEEILEIIDCNQSQLREEVVVEIKKNLHEFCVLILEAFRNEKKNNLI